MYSSSSFETVMKPFLLVFQRETSDFKMVLASSDKELRDLKAQKKASEIIHQQSISELETKVCKTRSNWFKLSELETKVYKTRSDWFKLSELETKVCKSILIGPNY